MRREWDLEDLIECWTLDETELKELGNKSGATRLGFALMPGMPGIGCIAGVSKIAYATATIFRLQWRHGPQRSVPRAWCPGFGR